MIILTQTESDAVRGETAPGYRLEPLPLANGTEWVLPEAVLDDPAHAVHHDLLAGLPRRDVAAGEWVQPNEA